MSNDGIYGLQEGLDPQIQPDGKVVVRRTLYRTNGAAAVPPGQSVEFEFSVAQFPFDIIIIDTGSGITTSDHSAVPMIGVTDSGHWPRVPDSAAAVILESRATSSPGTAAPTRTPTPTRTSAGGTRGRSRRGSDASATAAAAVARGAASGGVLVGTPVDTTGDGGSGGGTPPGAIARMRGIDTSIFGDALRDWTVDPLPPPDLPDRMIPFEVTLTPPNGLAPIVMTNPMQSRLLGFPMDTQARIDPDFLDRGRGLWKINVKNINSNARRMAITVVSNHAFATLQQRDLPLSLLNHLMLSVIKKSAPTIAFEAGRQDNVFVQTPTHFFELMGVDTQTSVGGVLASLVDSMPTFTPILAAIESRSALINRIMKRRDDLAAEYFEQVKHNPALAGRGQKAIDACNESINELTNLSAQQAQFCIVIEGMFSDAPISLDYIGEIARIDNKLPQIALVFGQGMELSKVVSNLAIDLSPALVKAALFSGALTVLTAAALGSIFGPIGVGLAIFGGYELYNSIEGYIDKYGSEKNIRQKIFERGPAISHYVKSSFERISALGASALRCELVPDGAPDGKDALRIYYFDPATAIPPRPRPRGIDDAALGFDTFMVASGDAAERRSTGLTIVNPRGRGRPVERRVALARETPGAPPADFKIGNAQTLNMLDQHSSIVVLMMENRSFDHFFHDLADTFPGRGYSRVPPDFTNVAPPGFGAPFGVTKNADIGIGNSLIFGWGANTSSLEPEHNLEHTAMQIGGGTEETKSSGAMQGFTVDFAKESDSPQIVMSYYGMESLPVYRVLADNYPVCDNWFAALPAGTYPNRLSMLQGNVPFLHNIHMDDPSIGYLEDYSIFDLMDSQGISWKFFESDIGTLRLYDRYRLNVTNVRPIEEMDDWLKTWRDTGQLPRVIFIEPQFLFGNDDHPPMNIRDGQDFVKQAIGKFIDYGLLDRVLFAITYDEHGGYFDHVPPPGTPNGPPEWHDQIACLFPQGTDEDRKMIKSLGVRVPSLLLSKFASNNAKHQVVDHVSILKTILLHNRLQISTAQFSRFGDRVKQENCSHLGELLDLQVPRQMDYAGIAQAMGYHSDASWFTAQSVIAEARVARLSPTHPAQVLRAIAQPRAKRYVAG